MTSSLHTFNAPTVGKSYNHRRVLRTYVGTNLLGRQALMVDYKYDHEPDGVKPATCSVDTFKKQTGRPHWYMYDKEGVA